YVCPRGSELAGAVSEPDLVGICAAVRVTRVEVHDGVERAVAVEVEHGVVRRSDRRAGDARVPVVRFEGNRLVLDDRRRRERSVALVLVDEPGESALTAFIRGAGRGERTAAAAVRDRALTGAEAAGLHRDHLLAAGVVARHQP